jgi:MYXO-CTERM domain-containing protein
MIPPNDDLRLDEQAAAMTDAMISGRQIDSTGAQEFEPIVRVLVELSSGEPSAVFRARLTARLSAEFDSVARPQRGRAFNWRLIALAAAVLVIAVGLVALVSSGGGSQPLQGTAVGGEGGTLVIVLGAALFTVFAAWLLRRRR